MDDSTANCAMGALMCAKEGRHQEIGIDILC